MPRKVTITQDPADEVPIEILAKNIRAISAGVKALRKGPLGENALLLLISENCTVKGRGALPVKAKISIKAVKSVLNSLETLEAIYVRQPKPKG